MRVLTRNILMYSFVFAGLSACQPEKSVPETVDAALVTEGKVMAQELCASCHAIGTSGDSPRGDAPPLRTVLANYNTESLGDDFREHIHVGHPDMPDFDFNVKQTDTILAYLKSIEE